MKGWTPDGREVELHPRQAECVRALLSRHPAQLPSRGYGFGWSTALYTAARYDEARRAGRPLDGDPGLSAEGYIDDPGRFAVPADLTAIRDRLPDDAESVRSWYEAAITYSSREGSDAGEDRGLDCD